MELFDFIYKKEFEDFIHNNINSLVSIVKFNIDYLLILSVGDYSNNFHDKIVKNSIKVCKILRSFLEL